MTFNDIHDLAKFIAKHHTSFAGRRIGGQNDTAAVFDRCMRTRDSLTRDTATVGITYEAEMQYLDDTGYHTLPTHITLEIDGEGLRYTEVPRAAAAR